MEDNSMKLTPLDDSMRVRNNINPVQNGAAPLPQGYDGTGVVMGFIDSGIDFTHILTLRIQMVQHVCYTSGIITHRWNGSTSVQLWNRI
ncbi:MAG: hypothetical protein R2847_05095 [Bacteroidia bacterium]